MAIQKRLIMCWLMMGFGVMAPDAVLSLLDWPEPVFPGLVPAFFGCFGGAIASLGVVVPWPPLIRDPLDHLGFSQVWAIPVQSSGYRMT